MYLNSIWSQEHFWKLDKIESNKWRWGKIKGEEEEKSILRLEYIYGPDKKRGKRHVGHQWSTQPDPLSDSCDNYSSFKVVSFCEISKSGDGRTDEQYY